MTPKQFVNFYGNKVKAAAELGVSVPTVTNWEQAEKIPYTKQLAIQALTKNKLLAVRNKND